VKQFYCYSICINGIPCYYGSGAADYGDGRGRIEEHQQKLRACLSGSNYGRHHLYASLAEYVQKGCSITYVKNFETDSAIEALDYEDKLINSHIPTKYPLLNRRISGRLYSPDSHLKLLSEPLPEDGRLVWKYKWKLKLHERSLRKQGLIDLADKFAQRYAAIAVNDTEAVNTTLAVQRTTRLALKKGFTDIANSLSVSRAVDQTIEAHRENNEMALESMHVRELIALDSSDLNSYIERLSREEKRLIEKEYYVLANMVSKRLRDVRKTIVIDGVKCLKSSEKFIHNIKSDHSLLALPYPILAKTYGLAEGDIARIIKRLGLKKANALTNRRVQLKEKFSALESPSWEDRGKQLGLSRMTAYRYAKELGMIKPTVPVIVPHQVKSDTIPKCHQRVIREQMKNDDVIHFTKILGNLDLIKVSDFVLAQECYNDEHRDFIKRYEWLGTPGVGIKWCFTARYKNQLGGVVLMSEPYHPNINEALIARGACASWTPKNLGSRLVMFGCRWMTRNTPKRAFVAYADTEAGEIGQIYQACNFTFLGFKKSTYGIDSNGNRKSFQTFKRTAHMNKWLKEQHITLDPSCYTPKGFLIWSAIPSVIKKQMRKHVKAKRLELAPVTIMRGKYVMAYGKLKSEYDAKSKSYPKRS
jgi:hypothetical protein